jgi:hypothetical protein
LVGSFGPAGSAGFEVFRAAARAPGDNAPANRSSIDSLPVDRFLTGGSGSLGLLGGSADLLELPLEDEPVALDFFFRDDLLLEP